MSPGGLRRASGGEGILSAEIWYDPWTHNKKNTHKLTCSFTHTVPTHPQSTMAKPCVSAGINRSVQSSSQPALKSFPEVVLQKPAAEEDKRVAIPRARRLLSSTQLSLCWPLPLLHPSLIPTFLPSLIISIPLLSVSISCFLSSYRSPPSLRPFSSQCLLSPAPPPSSCPSLHLSPSSCCSFLQVCVMNKGLWPSRE